jgi:hypothetical protein
MSVNFTLDDVVAKVREVAAERPTYVYNNEGMSEYSSSCFYRHGEYGERPGCIVGQALDRLGYVVPEVDEGTNAGVVLGGLFDLSDDDNGLKANWVWKVQKEQDGGKSWGDAILEADSYARLFVNA